MLAIAACKSHGADRIVAEINNGGDMVAATLRTVDPAVPFAAVHASRGKIVRAEPVAALYEEGKVRHLGAFPVLEDQMCGFTRESSPASGGGAIDAERRSGGGWSLSTPSSPDRVDALVWALSELLVQPMPHAGMFELYRDRATARPAPLAT